MSQHCGLYKGSSKHTTLIQRCLDVNNVVTTSKRRVLTGGMTLKSDGSYLTYPAVDTQRLSNVMCR